MDLTRSPTRPLTRAITESGVGGGANTMTVELASGYLYSRFPWDATYDAVQRVTVTAVAASSTANGCVQPSGIKLIPIATARTGMVAAFNAAASAQIIASQTDDAPPVKYNNHFMGGNHGPNVAKRITATAHGKTAGDIGSQWVSAGAVNFWIIAIIDANTLWVLSGNTLGSAERWAFNTTLPAPAALTHVAGATNTATINFTASVTTQIYPSVQDYTSTVKLNGSTPVTVDGVYDCRFVTIDESYGIVNPVAMLNYLIAGRPWASTPALNDSSITTQVTLTYNYRVEDNGCVAIAGGFNNEQTLDMSSGDGYVGFVQSQPIFWDVALSETVWMYVPRVGVVGGANYQNTADVSGAISQADFIKATWTDVTNPPDRMAQFIKDDGINRRGYAQGYSVLGGGAGADLDNYIVKSGFLTTARKMYVHCLTKEAPAFGAPASTLPINSAVSAVAYRIPFNLATMPSATVAGTLLNSVTGVAEVILDFHTDVTNYAVKVPTKLNGKAVAILRGSNLTLGSSVVANGEILVTTTGGYATANLSVGA